MSIATTFQPEMARSVARRDQGGFIDQTRRSACGLIALLTLPAAMLLFVLRRPMIGLLLEHGQFDAVDAFNTSRALGGFALGLVGFSAYLFTFRGFYAHQDTRTPFVINVVENLLNIVLAFVLVGSLGVLGLGLAYRDRLPAVGVLGPDRAARQGAGLLAARGAREPLEDAPRRRC